jgi:hypothetical protein
LKNKEFLKRLYTAAKLQKQLGKVQKTIAEEFVDCCEWDITDILHGCYEKDGKLYNSKGEMISSETCSGDISEKYFVNQSTGYCEDDFYGTLYYMVDNKGTTVEVSYHC